MFKASYSSFARTDADLRYASHPVYILRSLSARVTGQALKFATSFDHARVGTGHIGVFVSQRGDNTLTLCCEYCSLSLENSIAFRFPFHQVEYLLRHNTSLSRILAVTCSY